MTSTPSLSNQTLSLVHRTARAGAPGNAIVDQKGIRKAVAAERAFEVLLDSLGLLIAAGLKHRRSANGRRPW